jgi:hypothetical protein
LHAPLGEFLIKLHIARLVQRERQPGVFSEGFDRYDAKQKREIRWLAPIQTGQAWYHQAQSRSLE